jgi:hypothetical protein
MSAVNCIHAISIAPLLQMLPALTHHCDGLVFTPNTTAAPYGASANGAPPVLSWRGWQASKLGDAKSQSRGGSHVLPKQLVEFATTAGERK